MVLVLLPCDGGLFAGTEVMRLRSLQSMPTEPVLLEKPRLLQERMESLHVMLDCRCFMLLHDSTAWMIWRSVQPPRRLVCQILEFGLFQAGLWPRLLVAWHFNLLNYRVGHPLHDQIWWWFSWWYSSIGTKVLPTAVSSIRNMERNWCVDLAFVTFWYTMQGQAIWDKSVGIFTVWTFHEVMFGDDLLDMLDFACLEVSSMPCRMPWRDPRAEDGDEAVLWSNLTWVLLCKTSANQRQKKKLRTDTLQKSAKCQHVSNFELAATIWNPIGKYQLLCWKSCTFIFTSGDRQGGTPCQHSWVCDLIEHPKAMPFPAPCGSNDHAIPFFLPRKGDQPHNEISPGWVHKNLATHGPQMWPGLRGLQHATHML